ncbi:hypothetical protein QJS10_CPB04g00564 [Acorus calamus]|uniref:Non-structural maintenance of chromosomes element 1 homolog n=1 Tax=Acorus calamus TaxID=4465 RepID=A0AAV9EZQ4_ACOCL|nr:hypothetical protein QJS10_CPB04g00564 [Acorus calamus]
MAQLSWKHHTLIQALLSRGPLEEVEFHSMFLGVSGRNPVTHPQALNDALLKINKELAYVQFELRACRNQYDGKVYYGVINTVADEQSKLGSKYSVPQIAFYKAIIEAIVRDGGGLGCVSNIDVLNIRLDHQVQNDQGAQGSHSSVPSAFKSFSITQKEKALDELVKDRWLCSISAGKIGLGVRSFLDLRSWFRRSDVPSCDVCNEAGVKADMCPNESCNIRIHAYCLKKKFARIKGARACPGCKTRWPNHEQNEEVEEENEVTSKPTQSQAPPAWAPTSKRLRSSRT